MVDQNSPKQSYCSHFASSRTTTSGHVNEVFSSGAVASNLAFTGEQSSSSSEDLDDPEWMENVNNRGNVLYVQPDVSEESLQAHSQLVNGGYLLSTSNENLLNIDDKKPGRSKFFKPTTKLKALINKSKEHRDGRSLASFDRPETIGGHADVSCHQRLSFSDYEVYDVLFNVHHTQRNLGRRASRFESMLGMISRTRFDNSHQSLEGDTCVIVHGFIPDSCARSNCDVQIGDWIRFINHIEVDCHNVNRVLESCYGTNQVKLTIYRPRLAPLSDSNLRRSSKNNTSVNRGSIKILSGHNEIRQMEHVIDDFTQQYHHIAMFLTSPSSSNSLHTEEDIKYEYPAGLEKKLKTVRGLFYTVCNVMPDVTSSTPTSSTMIYNEHLIHVCYIVEDRQVLVIALPAQCLTLMELQQIANEIVRFLRLEHKSLARAFEDHENKLNLDEMFGEIFRAVLVPRYQQNSSYFLTRSLEECFGLSKSSPLPDDLQLAISDFLSELESADFSDFIDIGPRRSFALLGCCFHFKGYLIANHLPTSDLEDIHSILKFNYLLKMTSGAAALVSRLIMWKEVYPSSKMANAEEYVNHQSTRDSPRYFLLTVGIKHGLLSTLLESGSFINGNSCGYPGPNPAYIDKAKETLEAIFDDGIAEQINHIIECSSNNQDLANPQAFLQKAKFSGRHESRDSSNLFSIFSKSGASSISSSRHKSMTDLRTISKQGDTEFDGSSSRSHGTCDDATPILGRRYDRQHSKPQTIDVQSRTSSADNLLWKESGQSKRSAFDLASLRQETRAIMGESVLRNNTLVAGHENTLFQYINVENSDGVMIFPTETLKRNENSLQMEVLENFRRSCLIIRKTFRNSYKNKDKRKQEEGGIFNCDNPLNHVNEQGMLFHCQVGADKRQSNSLIYWVVGRQFINPRPREVYVCFHESAPQNTIELAFKLGYGWTS